MKANPKQVVLTAACALLSAPVWATGGHSPLIPQPQEIRYGDARLPLRGLSIRFAAKPSAEDRFTAAELSRTLSEAAGTAVPVAAGAPAGHAITLKRTGEVDALPVPGERPGPQSREAYSIHVTPAGVQLEGRSTAALYYAALTLRQMVEESGGAAALPEAEVRDWPSLAYRGVMPDFGHGAMPTEAEVKREIDNLARWKNNQYYLYTEGGIELKGYPLLGRDGRFGQDEVRRIVAYARERHMDVVPCLELYGHMHDLFRVERYAGLSMIPHGSDFDPRKPETAALLANWVDQLTALFPSPFFHVGLDEAHEAPALGGAFIFAGENPGSKLNAASLYMQHFRRLYELLSQHHKKVMLWDDMFAHMPEMIPQLPPDVIVVPWGYDRTVYQPYWKPFADSPLTRFIATGVTIWDDVGPNYERSFDNIDTFIAKGRPHGVAGLINTVWTDDIAVLMRPAYPGMAYGAAAAWQEKPVDRASFFRNYARIVYPAAAAEAAAGIEEVGRAEVALAKAVGGSSEQTSPSFWDDPLTAGHLERASKHREDFHQTRLLAESAEEHLDRAIAAGADDGTLSDLLLQARMLDYDGMKNLYAAEIADFWRNLGDHPKRDKLEYWLQTEISSHDHSRIQDLMDASGDLMEAFRTEWLSENTPYRLGGVLGKWDAEFQYWWRLSRRIRDYARSFRDGDTMKPLESLSPGY